MNFVLSSRRWSIPAPRAIRTLTSPRTSCGSILFALATEAAESAFLCLTQTIAMPRGVRVGLSFARKRAGGREEYEASSSIDLDRVIEYGRLRTSAETESNDKHLAHTRQGL